MVHGWWDFLYSMVFFSSSCVIVCRIVLCNNVYLLYIKRENSYNYSQIYGKNNIDSKHQNTLLFKRGGGVVG